MQIAGANFLKKTTFKTQIEAMKIIQQNKQIALDWIAAFNTHDVDAILKLYDDNAIHFSPKLKVREPQTNGFVIGKIQMKQWWDDAFTRLPSLNYELINLIVDENNLLMEYKRTVDGEADMMVAEVLEIQNGLIVKSRVYHA